MWVFVPRVLFRKCINAVNPVKKSIFVTAVEFVPAFLRRKSLKI